MSTTVINQHRSIAKTDINSVIDVTGHGTDRYTVVLLPEAQPPLRVEQEIKFHHLDAGMPPGLYPVGLTNEVLLAIVADRLYQFQGGQCACEENAIALQHVNGALAALKARTVRRANQGIEGKMEEKKAEEKPRVRMEGDTLFIKNTGFPPGALAKWGTWSAVENQAKALEPRITTAEMQVIEDAAGHLGVGAKNGLAEFKSAMASTRKA